MSSVSLPSIPTPGPITPHLVVSDAKAAIAFYARAFGATVLHRMDTPDGKILHCTLAINEGMVFLCDDFPEMASGTRRTPEALGGSPVAIHLHVTDADAAFDRALESGAKVIMPLADQFWGDRFGKLEDPFGHQWTIGARLRQVSEADMRLAADAFAGGPDQG